MNDFQQTPFSLHGIGLGAATSATQIEGGEATHSWTDWCEGGYIHDRSHTRRAGRHLLHVNEDADLLQNLGLSFYRMGLEWSRIEPEEGHFDEEIIAAYRAEIEELTSRGVRPLITLHHFTNPCWFEKKGAFLQKENVPVFLRFCERMVHDLGDIVSDFCTINEPNVYATNGYFFGSWPPGQKSIRNTMRVLRNLADAHRECYLMIHRVRKELGKEDTMVGFANHLRVFVPKNKKNPLDRMGVWALENAFQTVQTDAFMRGILRFPLGFSHRHAGKYYDYIGINYYTRSAVSRFADGFFSDKEQNDLGWEIYPEGLRFLAEEQYRRYQAPVWITENGMADNTSVTEEGIIEDNRRCAFLCNHLRELSLSKADVARYYHWSLLDNFEWLEGESARFGLVHIDFETDKRTPKKSADLYRDFAKHGGLTEEMIQTYHL